jgi:peptidoglycan/LPS O-acetylase OafA/YrhL
MFLFKNLNQKPGSNRLDWVEWIKAIALIWIFLNHVAERIFGYPWISNPNLDWPSLSDRIAQLAPVQGYGWGDVFVNLFRYLGWFGDQGVQLFLIMSGFGLTWGLLARGQTAPISIKDFYFRRLARIYPLWWGAHILFFVVWLFLGRGLALTEIESWISFVGLRVTPTTFYYFSPAWWYFALILQLYLVFPLLWEGLRRWGALRFLLVSSAVAFVIRGIGLLVLTDYLDVWQRGGIFITRLPEFAFGMALAAWLYTDRENVEKKLTSPWAITASLGVYALGLVFSLSLVGMTLGPFFLGTSAFLLFYNLVVRILARIPRWLALVGIWIGLHSYSLYLVHHPVVNRLVPEGASISFSFWMRMGLAWVGSLVLALALEFGVEWIEKQIRRSHQARGWMRTGFRIAIFGGFVVAFFLAAEVLVRQFAPQEIYGWGERPSLQVHPIFGWTLIPGKTTQLRWQHYDYTVTSNSLGFPGPEYPLEKSEGDFRILVTGDAFSSAEGVDTELAWPRLLEASLNEKTGKLIQVMNFSITGYGPNQYAAVVNEFAPVYRPDLVLVEVFVNDFDDVWIPNEIFQQYIGFGQPSQNGISSYLRLEHFRSFFRYDVLDPWIAPILSQAPTKGYFLGNFSVFENVRREDLLGSKAEVASRLEEIQSRAKDLEASLLVVVVPASIQVCQPSELDYYPRNVDFNNQEQFDPEIPQKLFSEIGEELNLSMIDLRKAFEASSECPYQSQNMHWTETGHQVVTAYLANYILQENWIGETP